ncbi:MAG: recombination protein F [Nodularia sp. (in: Bacteria)]|nr:MAG: recombination protein F [Nodularia sp. (in: cyanobacteria)]
MLNGKGGWKRGVGSREWGVGGKRQGSREQGEEDGNFPMTND